MLSFGSELSESSLVIGLLGSDFSLVIELSVLMLRTSQLLLPNWRGLPEVCTSCITSQSTLHARLG